MFFPCTVLYYQALVIGHISVASNAAFPMLTHFTIQQSKITMVRSPLTSYLFIYFYCILLFMLSQWSLLFPLSLLHPAPPTLGNPHTIVCVLGLCTYVLWPIPSPSFIQSPAPPLQHVSMLLSLFCSLDSTYE